MSFFLFNVLYLQELYYDLVFIIMVYYIIIVFLSPRVTVEVSTLFNAQ